MSDPDEPAAERVIREHGEIMDSIARADDYEEQCAYIDALANTLADEEGIKFAPARKAMRSAVERREGRWGDDPDGQRSGR